MIAKAMDAMEHVFELAMLETLCIGVLAKSSSKTGASIL